MRINLVHAVNAAMTDTISEQLSQKFGIPVQFVRQVALRITPGLVAALMDRASLAAGARALHSVVMQPENNAYIVDQFDKLISTTGGLKHLELSGHSLAALAVGQRMDVLTDAVSAETGVPTQATSALAGIVAATLFGIVKRHVLLAQWDLTHFPALLREQIPEINASLSNGTAAAIGVGNTEGFVSSIGTRLDAVSSALAHEAAAPVATPVPVVETAPAPAPLAPAPVAAPAAASRPAQLRAPVRTPAKKNSNKWVWLLFAVLAAILALVYYRGFTHQGTVSLDSFSSSSSSSPSSAASAVSADSASTAQAAAVVPEVVTANDGAASAASATDGAASDASAASASVGASAPAAASAANATAIANQDAQLLFDVSAAGVPSIKATVGSDADKQRLTDALTQRFGKQYSADITVSPQTRPAAWLAHLADFLPLMAVPGAEVKVNGDRVELSGAAADSKLGWTDRLKSALGGAFQVGSFDVGSAVASAERSFQKAVKSLVANADECAGPKLTKVLDLQVVNFDSSSATVPQNAYSTLGQTAQLLKNCAAKGATVKLSIEGYSDTKGGHAAKLELSKERAQAVRGYLVRAGVPPQSLTAIGHGDADPVADNATASGRFANRRIEFIVK